MHLTRAITIQKTRLRSCFLLLSICDHSLIDKIRNFTHYFRQTGIMSEFDFWLRHLALCACLYIKRRLNHQDLKLLNNKVLDNCYASVYC